MLKHCIKLLIGCTLVFSASCKKPEDQWKIPTSLKFKADINRSSCLGGNLSFDGGNLMISEFTFEGTREQGGPVDFTKTYSGLNVPFCSNPVSEWSFAVPQGTYSEIKIGYKTFGNSGDNHIVVLGTYKNTLNNNTFPVRFEYQDSEVYSIIGNSSYGGPQIVLNKDLQTNAEIIMNPVYWFQVVTTNLMDTASLTNIGGVQTILINKITNSTIYNTVKDRIDDNVTQVDFNN